MIEPIEGNGEAVLSGTKGSQPSFGEALRRQATTGASTSPPPGLPTELFGPDGISPTDINQGRIGDCYFLSSLGELASNDPGFIRQMIHDNGNGTYTVTLYEKESVPVNFGRFEPIEREEYVPVEETVSSKDFSPKGVNSQPGQAVVDGKKIIWPQVMEAAYAKLNGGYRNIGDGGWPSDAMGTLTGRDANLSSPPTNQKSFAALKADLAKGDLVTLDTGNESSPAYDNLVGDHSYEVIGTSMDSKGNEYVELLNPWGFDEPDPVPLAAFGTVFDGWDVGTAPGQKAPLSTSGLGQKPVSALPTTLFGPYDPSPVDINRGLVGDSGFLSALGELASNDPGFLRQMIHDNRNGTYTVTLYKKEVIREGRCFSSERYVPVEETVSSKDFSPIGVNSQQGQAVYNGQQIVWPQVMEAAYAKLNGGWGNIGSVSPSVAMETLTGRDASTNLPPPPFVPLLIPTPGPLPIPDIRDRKPFLALQAQLAQGDLVTFDTVNRSSLPYNLVGNQSYMVIGAYTDSKGTEYVELLNPSGGDQPTPVPLFAWGTVFDGIDVGTAPGQRPPPIFSF